MKILEKKKHGKKKFEKKKNHEHMEIHGFWRLEVHTPILEYNKPFKRN